MYNKYLKTFPANLHRSLRPPKKRRQRLKIVTQEAIDAGAFGGPTFVIRQDGIEPKLFFGQGYNICV